MRILLLFLLLSAVSDGSSSLQFVLVNTPVSWFSAQTYCREHHADLLTVKDQTDYDEVVRVLSGEWVWMGLYRMNSNSPWIWSDQTTFSYSRWVSGEPNDHDSSQICAATSVNGWYDNTCLGSSPFLCSVAPPTVKKRQVLRVEVKSDEDVNDPEVKKKVLEKIQHILYMKGLGGNVTLSWRIQSDGNVFQKKPQNKDTQLTCP